MKQEMVDSCLITESVAFLVMAMWTGIVWADHNNTAAEVINLVAWVVFLSLITVTLLFANINRHRRKQYDT